MPNFTQTGQTVWISIGYEYIYFVLYILDYYVITKNSVIEHRSNLSWYFNLRKSCKINGILTLEKGGVQ